jgi:uncharacterized membrane protein YhaH (DUF805 family)
MMSLPASTGRISRSTFWLFSAFFFGVYFVCGVVMPQLPDWAKIVFGIGFFILSLVSIIVQIKRWHDRDKSGWWVLINFIPLVGPLWMLVECGFLRGTTGENRFGRDPLGESA